MRPSAEHTPGPSSSSTTGSSAATPSPPTLPVADASSSSSSSPSPAALETLSSSTSSQGTSDASEQRQDREVLKLWSIYMTPLRTLQPWSDAAWTVSGLSRERKHRRTCRRRYRRHPSPFLPSTLASLLRQSHIPDAARFSLPCPCRTGLIRRG